MHHSCSLKTQMFTSNRREKQGFSSSTDIADHESAKDVINTHLKPKIHLSIDTFGIMRDFRLADSKQVELQTGLYDE